MPFQGKGAASGLAARTGRPGIPYITTSSAFNAPAFLMAWKMAMMSRGVTPKAFRDLAKSATLELVGSILISVLGSLIETSSFDVEFWIWVVLELAELVFEIWACWLSLTWTTMLPWDTATSEMLTFPPAMTVPVFSFRTTRAT